MDKIAIWIYVITAVIVALTANSISTLWAGKENWLNVWLLLLVIISPFVFITFGLVTNKIGLAASSGTIDSLLTITSILVGLIVFREWATVSSYQYYGMGLAIVGIILMQIGR